MLFIPWEISLSFLFREKKQIEMHRGLYIYAKCKKKKKKVHPVFEKLEFYLNLKNDFALTFIQDERRVYFFFGKKKIPKMLTKRDTWKIFSRTRRHKSYWEGEYSIFFFSLFFLLFFVFVNCSKKNHFDCSFCSLFHSFRLFFWGKI